MDEAATGDDVMNRNRRCTDVLFLILYAAFMVAFFAIGVIGFTSGDPRILLYGTDYEGKLCTEDLPARYWVNPLEIYELTQATHTFDMKDVKSICLKDCPVTASTGLNWVCNYPDSVDGYGYADTTRDEWAANNYDYYDMLSDALKKQSLNNKGPCYPVLLPTVNAYESCTYYGNASATAVTALKAEMTDKGSGGNLEGDAELLAVGPMVAVLSATVSDYLSTPMATFERYVDDFSQAWVVLLVMGFIAPVVLSFVWMGVLRYFTGMFAYLIIFMVNAMAMLCTLYLYMKAGVIGSDQVTAYVGTDMGDNLEGYTDPSEDNAEVMEVCAHIALAITICLFLFSILMLKRVRTAVAVIKVATQAIGGAPSVVFFPLAPVFASLLFGAWWIAAGIYIYSSGEIKQQTCTLEAGKSPMKYCADTTNVPNANCHCGYESVMDESLQYTLLYHLFGLLWTTQFFQAMTMLTLASVFATYYFRGGSYGTSLSGWLNTPVIQAFRKMSWYHTGSAAFGSLLVAILQFIRIIVAYMVHQLKKAGKDNVLVKYAACCVQYCLWYLQKIIEWINRNTYILIAIEGKSFCASAMEALSLIFNNLATVGAVNVIGDVLLFLGKLSVSLTCGVLAFLYLDDDAYTTGENKVSSPLLIVVFCIIFGFVIAGLFMSVVEMAIDTTLLSFCKDCKLHGGKPRYAPPLLESVLGKFETKAEKEANKNKA